ncbi:MAG: AAA family ATPase [Mycoplasmataceae bacterium]|nr:AAA family ATPase [Mycoplasmataceae bacterium]
MIKQIIFRRTTSLSDELLTINFSDKINIIIGPKGGGKSTLFDLLASITNGYISKNVISALKEFNLEFLRAIKFNNETINVTQLGKKTEKEKITDFSERDDVIFQDDPIKKNINNREDINKEKTQFILNLIDQSTTVEKLIEKIRVFYNGMEMMMQMNQQSKINWTNSFQIKTISDKIGLINKLNYDPIDINQKISNDQRNLIKIIDNSSAQINQLKKFQQFNFNNVIIDHTFNEQLNKDLETLIENHEKLLLRLRSRELYVKKISKMITIFQSSYKKVIDEIKKNDFNIQGLKTYEKESQDYFKKMASTIVNQEKLFEELINQDVVLNFDNEIVDNNSLLSYKIAPKVNLNQEQIIEIFKIVLPTPGSSISDISKWLSNLIKKGGVKDFDVKRISKSISKNLLEHVQVLAEGKDYNTMSLGQKSIYGIKYKFNRSIDKILFLDQPEDNLDNFTISQEMLNLLLNKEQQTFIVTHNANIGILTNPGKVIVADLNNGEEQYYEAIIAKDANNESASAHYLEGGVQSLEARYKKIKGER